jgi:hypothetical protein
VDQRKSNQIMARLRAADPTRRALAQRQVAENIGRTLEMQEAASCCADGSHHGHSHGDHGHAGDDDDDVDELLQLRMLRLAQLQKQQDTQRRVQSQATDALAKATPLEIDIPAITTARQLLNAREQNQLVLCAVVARTARLEQEKLSCAVIEVLTRLSRVRGVYCGWVDWEAAGSEMRSACAKMGDIRNYTSLGPPCLLVLPRQHGTAVCVPRSMLEGSVRSNGAWMLSAIGAAGGRFRPNLCDLLLRAEKNVGGEGDECFDFEDGVADEDDEDPSEQYCDKPGCGRAFAHEHVQRLRKEFADDGEWASRSNSSDDELEEDDDDYGA